MLIGKENGFRAAANRESAGLTNHGTSRIV